MTFFEKVLQLDRDLFFLINSKWSNPFFDLIMPYARNAATWIPLYLFFLIFISVKHAGMFYWRAIFTFSLTIVRRVQALLLHMLLIILASLLFSISL